MTVARYEGTTTDGERLVLDFDTFPALSLGALRVDAPRAPLGSLKRALRAHLQLHPRVEAAYLLLVSDDARGGRPQITIGIVGDGDIDDLARTWTSAHPDDAAVAFFHVMDDAVSFFARTYLLPFYPASAAVLPASLPDAALMSLIQKLPERPHLAATAAHLETLKESYEHLPAEAAEAEDRAQRQEAEELLQEMRGRSTHGAARQFLLDSLTSGARFSLLLRTFEREVVSGASKLTGGNARLWLLERPLEAHIARVTPLPLIGIANPLDPFPPSGFRLLEVGDEWLEVVVSLVARAAAIFLICDRVSPGIAQELLVVDRLAREDDTVVIVDVDDAMQRQKPLNVFEDTRDVPPLDSSRMARRLAGFGLMTTSAEFLAQSPYHH